MRSNSPESGLPSGGEMSFSARGSARSQPGNNDSPSALTPDPLDCTEGKYRRKYPIIHHPCCSVQLMKHTGGSSRPPTHRPPKIQTWSRLSTQGHRGVHPAGAVASVRVRDVTRSVPQNQPALALICLHWTCGRDPQHAKIRRRFLPSILICQVG